MESRRPTLGPKQRFSEINARLKSNTYNNATRKANRKYLNNYVRTRKNTGTPMVEARKRLATNYLIKINSLGVVPSAAPSTSRNLARVATPPPPVVARSVAPPPPVVARSVASPPPVVAPVAKPALYEQVDVRGDGNCFYRAIYRAANENEDRTMLDRVFSALGADKTKMRTEDEGQAALRKATANYYRSIPEDGIYETLLTVDKDTLRQWANQATKKQRKIYLNASIYATMPRDTGKVKFYQDLADVIDTDMEFATQADYDVVKNLLELGGIAVVSTHVSPESPLFNGRPALYIRRVNQNHYNYWRRKVFKGILKPSTGPAMTRKRSLSVASTYSNAGSSTNGSNSSENNSERSKIQELLERSLDEHARCVQKCKVLKTKVDELRARLIAK